MDVASLARLVVHSMTRKHSFFALAMAVTIGLSSCKTQDEQLVGKPPEAESELVAKPRLVQKAERPERPPIPDPGLLVQTWPYVEDRKTFVLTWQGGDQPVPLHEAPDPNSPLLGEVTWDNGERILWQGTAVAVYQPAVVRAKEEWLVEGVTYNSGYVTDPEYVSVMVKKGQPVEVWLYAAAGQCYLRLDQKVIQGTCPPPESFHGAFQGEMPAEWYQPAQKVWWIQISGSNLTGWFPVDDRVVVDIIDE